MEIPKVYSAPADPTAPSLLNLPAEIRTTISRLVFVQPDPILIHNAEFYYNHKPVKPELCENYIEKRRGSLFTSMRKFGRYVRYRNIRKLQSYIMQFTYGEKRCPILDENDFNRDYAPYYKKMLEWNERNQDAHDQAEEFNHYSSFQLGLLLSCRQIYHEVVGIFYGNNTFIVSRVCSRHDTDHTISDASEGEYNQFHYGPLWLRSLGTQAGMIRKVAIDATAVCNATFSPTKTHQLLPYLHILWATNLAGCEITFADTGRMHLCNYGGFSYGYRKVDVGRLNRILVTLGREDALGLRRVSQSGLLDSVKLGIGGGVVTYYPSRKDKPWRRFSISEESGLIQWAPEEPIFRRLTGIPLALICRYAAFPQDVVKFDLHKRTVAGFNWSIFHVSRDIREACFNSIKCTPPVIMEVEATKTIADFDEFKSLQRFYRFPEDEQARFVHRRIIISSQGLYPHDCCTLLLKFRLATRSTLAKVRINLSGLLTLCNTRRFNFTGIWAIKIQLRYLDRKGRIHSRENRLYFENVIAHVYFYFTDLLYHLPPNRLPIHNDIWMDGHGSLYQKATSNSEVLPVQNSNKSFGIGGTELRRMENVIYERFFAEGSAHRSWNHERHQCMYFNWKMLHETLFVCKRGFHLDTGMGRAMARVTGSERQLHQGILCGDNY